MSQAFRIDLGVALLRLMLAAVFIFHGSQKLFGWFGGGGFEATAQEFEGMGMPLPMISAALAGGAEFFGGLAFLLGVGVRLAAIPLTFTMLVASFAVHGGAFALPKGMEYALTLAVASAAVGLIGSGRFRVNAPKSAS